jgi:ribonuclease P protein component
VRIRSNEADISAQPNQTPSQTRFQGTDEDEIRACDLETPPRKGSEATCCDRCVQVEMSEKTGRFQRSDRLRDSRDFRRVMRRGRRRSDQDLLVVSTRRQDKHNKSDRLKDSDSHGSRLGITASRKVGGAVVRNRFKRRVREWFRLRRPAFSEGLDLVVIGSRSGAALSLEELDERLSRLLGLASSQYQITQGPLG